MATQLDHRGWTAARYLAPCVLCHQPAILRSPRGKPCHWTCAVAWVNEHQDHDQERAQARCTLVDPCHQPRCGGCYPEQYLSQGLEHWRAARRRSDL